MNKGITIIICTFNGAERLGKTIEHIARQDVPKDMLWEVILADNASTDNSSVYAVAEWNKYGLKQIPFRVINEAEAGKLYALQHAIRKANYEYLVICDDDNWLAPDYIRNVYPILDTMPEIGAAGGRGVPVTSGIPLPEWFGKYNAAYAVGPQSDSTGILKPRDILWGAGLATRKSLYLEMYKDFPSLLSLHPDKKVLSAEDTEYCMRLILKGYKLYYDSSLVYEHFIPDFKLTDVFREDRLLKGFTEAHMVLRKYYTAMRATVKTKGRPDIWLGLLLVTPFNYLFSFSKKRAEKAKDTLFYLLPFHTGGDSAVARIKSFIKG